MDLGTIFWYLHRPVASNYTGSSETKKSFLQRAPGIYGLACQDQTVLVLSVHEFRCTLATSYENSLKQY